MSIEAQAKETIGQMLDEEPLRRNLAQAFKLWRKRHGEAGEAFNDQPHMDKSVWWDIVGQTWAARDHSDEDAAIAMDLYCRWRLGEYAAVVVHTGSVPTCNDNTEGNAAPLRSLCAPFSGTFFGKARSIGDGTFTWSEAVVGTLHDGTEVIIPAGEAPLEVGTTRPHTSAWHLGTAHRLARWPYGFEFVVVLYRLDPDNDGRGPH